MPTDKRLNADLLYGVTAIATHLGMTAAQVYHLHGKGSLPTFKVGAKVCASKQKLDAWVQELAEGGGDE
ncbi:MAG: DNA-binding protein [Proteobacteria bacterium]|nr:DNA-binding protein [Pseudomonadota bacterium]